MDTGIEAFKKAISEHLGGQVATAKVVGVTQQGISKCLRRGGPVPAEWCLPIEAATNGAITRHQLRPDIYPIEAS